MNISVSGKIASGKTTVADYIKEQYGFTQIRSAKYLKELCALIANKNLFLLAGFPTQIIDQKIAELLRYISISEEEYQHLLLKTDEYVEMYHDITDTSKKTNEVRSMLQDVAYKIKEEVRQSIWIDSCLKDMYEMDGENFIHDDLRYPFEHEKLRQHGFILIRLDIDEATQAKRVKKLYGNIDKERFSHISETALDGYEFDYRIDASLPLEEVLRQVDEIIKGA